MKVEDLIGKTVSVLHEEEKTSFWAEVKTATTAIVKNVTYIGLCCGDTIEIETSNDRFIFTKIVDEIKATVYVVQYPSTPKDFTRVTKDFINKGYLVEGWVLGLMGVQVPNDVKLILPKDCTIYNPNKQ